MLRSVCVSLDLASEVRLRAHFSSTGATAPGRDEYTSGRRRRRRWRGAGQTLAAAGQHAHQPDDHGDHEQDDADPQQEVQRLDEPTREQQDDGDDGDDDQEDVHEDPFHGERPRVPHRVVRRRPVSGSLDHRNPTVSRGSLGGVGCAMGARGRAERGRARRQGRMGRVKTIQLRRYTLVDGEYDAFVEWWRGAMPAVRPPAGFTIEFAYGLRESNEFVWAVSAPGDRDEFARLEADLPRVRRACRGVRGRAAARRRSTTSPSSTTSRSRADRPAGRVQCVAGRPRDAERDARARHGSRHRSPSVYQASPGDVVDCPPARVDA